MPEDARLVSDRFPRAARYHPDWVIGNASSGSHSLALLEWLTTALDLRPGMRVLDLGCGRALTSIFLRREFGVTVWATDLWISPSENALRIRDAGVADGVFPIHATAHSLPFAAEFFDAIICVDSFMYFGTDVFYLNYLANFVKVGGPIAVVGAGLTREVEGPVPEYLREWWVADQVWSLHSADWLRRHWERTGIVDVECADTMPDGWRLWLDWHKTSFPDNRVEIAAVEADAGRTLGYIRAVGRRRADAQLLDYAWPDTMRFMPVQPYVKKPLLRGER
jgi:cyclopropane fatty-acyl-phospholipid synthase-like methyltransferase